MRVARRRRRLAAVVLALASLLALGGCGTGGGRGATGVSLLVTRDFGTFTVGSVPERPAMAGDTVMRLLERHFDVRARYGGGFVQAINGLGGGRADGRPIDWFLYVNGIEATQGAAATDVSAGDRIWWDRHDWGAAMSIPAVVGSFPEPFRSGSGGKRVPVRIDCANDAQQACGDVAAALRRIGLTASTAFLGAPAGKVVLRVLVGTLKEIGVDAAGASIGRGPGASGVYARFDPGGRTLVALDPRGAPVRTLGAGSGLVAATRFQDQAPTWVVTGTDTQGVRAAARALQARTLAQHFAVAIDDGRIVPLPIVPAA